MTAIVISGFSSSDRVPGFYGENLFGTGNTSASSLPLILLLCGLKGSGGTATADTDVKDILSETDARTYFGARSELSNMCISALQVPGVQVKAIAAAAAGGAVAANASLVIGGTWSTAGTLRFRIGGRSFELTIGASDSVTNVGDNFVSLVAADVDCPFTGVNTTGTVVLTCADAGARGNLVVLALDTTSLPSGCTATITGSAWVANTAYTTNVYAHPTTANGFYYKATTGGTSHAAVEPVWPTTIGATVVDNTVTWTCWGQVLSENRIYPGGGAGTENVSNVITTLGATQYDRIAIAQIDVTNLGRWETANDTDSGPTVGVLQQIVVAYNSTLVASTSLAQTTLNNALFQFVWGLNIENPPSDIAAYIASLRASGEREDPARDYDDVEVLGAYPQAVADRPSHATLISAINNSVTPLYTTPDGKVRIVRSITTYSLNGSTPDYSTLDTSVPTVGQFIRADLRLLWISVKALNPRVADDPATGERARPAGVLTPATWNGYVTNRLRDYEAGTNFPAPIIVNVSDHLPVSTYNAAAKRIMSAASYETAASNHQIGVSVRSV